MLKCWEENPSDRPTFAKLKNTMKEMERNHRVMHLETRLEMRRLKLLFSFILILFLIYLFVCLFVCLLVFFFFFPWYWVGKS